jgi:hypothetical protein
MIKEKFHFTFSNIEHQYKEAINSGYSIITCKDFVLQKNKGFLDKIIINRVDIDFSIKKAEKLGEIFNNQRIKASFFIRLHAPEYNPFSFENYRIIKFLINSGHEIGYHSEVIDQSTIWSEKGSDNLKRDIDILNRMFDIQIVGVASHGGLTGLNNLDFWKDHKPSDFGLIYEAYDWINETFYISDSEWTQWKCYNKGVLLEGDRRSFEEHLKDNHSLIYLLIHSDTFFDIHFYE